MIPEIIILVLLSRLMYEQAEDKDLPPIPMVLAFLAMWIGCEFLGVLLAILFGPPGIGMLCGMYVLSIMGAAIGGGSVFAFVAFYPRHVAPRLDADVPDPKEFFRKKGKKRRRCRRAEEENVENDERPRRRPRNDEDDDAPRPSRARRNGDDEDEEPDTRIRRRRDD